MHTQELIPRLSGLTRDEVERWVDAALAEVAALRQHDDRLFPLTDDAAAMETARALHDALRNWADDAAALLAREATPADRDGSKRLDDLRFAIGYARGLNQMPPEEMLARQRRVERGEAPLHTIGEARRELGLSSLR